MKFCKLLQSLVKSHINDAKSNSFFFFFFGVFSLIFYCNYSMIAIMYQVEFYLSFIIIIIKEFHVASTVVFFMFFSFFQKNDRPMICV
jgi:hypothetical protein